CEDRPRTKRECRVFWREDVRARNVGRKKIWRELNAPRDASERGGERFYERCLRDSGNPFQENVTAREERHEEHLDGARRADVCPRDLAAQVLEPLPCGCNLVCSERRHEATP